MKIETALKYQQAGNIDKAEKIYQEILADEPNNSFVWYQCGLIFVTKKNYEEARKCFEKAISLRQNYSDALLALGFVFQEHGKLNEAEANYRQVLSIKPDHTEAYLGLGIISNLNGKPDEAIKNYRIALSINPNHVEAYKGVGGILNDTGRHDEAIEVYKYALSINSNHEELYISLANSYKAKREYDLSIETYKRAISIAPNNARAHLYLGIALLLCGNFETGWKEYEWRWKAEPLIFENRNYIAPRWNGATLNGKKIFLYCEQGYGDAIQFIRYIKYVKARGADIILECDRPLERLFSGIADISQIILKGNPIPAFDCHCPLLSLPYVFGTVLDTIPADVPYLSIDSHITEKWQNRFKNVDALKVGIVWAGNPIHQKDRLRSIPLSIMRSIIETEGIKFFSLQVGNRVDEIKQSGFSDRIVDLSKELSDFAETAGAISALDLVIGVDTAVIHLAGALKKPVWTLIQFSPDFRWMRKYEHSPWYPTMRLFRQDVIGNWESVISRISADLKSFCNGNRQILEPKPIDKKEIHSAIIKPRPALPDNIPLTSPKVEIHNSSLIANNSLTSMKQCRYGKMVYLRSDMYVGKSLDIYGEFSEGEPILFRQFIRPGDVVIEAGANIGAHTVFLAQAVGKAGVVIAYEPQRFIFQILCANVVLNELTNVYTRHAAVGSNTGIIRVPQLDYGSVHNFGGLSLSNTQEGEPVLMETIDSLNLTCLRLIKADVEGMEIEVLKGARYSIQQLRPILYMENDRKEKSKELIRFIRDMEYRLWWHLPPLYNPENFAKNAENVFGNIVSINILCIPKEKSAHISGLEEVK